MNEWTVIEPLCENRYDTPELVEERKTLNAEVAGILAEREAIDRALEAVKNTPVAKLTVQQIADARSAKERHFDLLKRELQFREEMLPGYYQRCSDAARAASKVQAQVLQEAESEVIAGLEALGYLKGKPGTPGTWTDEMVSRHPRVISEEKLRSSLASAASGYGDTIRQNAAEAQGLDRSLNSVMRQLVGVSNGIEVSAGMQRITVQGIG